ncbi:hypothetical protein ACFL09_00860 [Planctomycetota bacterium]
MRKRRRWRGNGGPAVREAESLFGLDGGILLGPSHEITPDTPIESILAVFGQ